MVIFKSYFRCFSILMDSDLYDSRGSSSLRTGIDKLLANTWEFPCEVNLSPTSRQRYLGVSQMLKRFLIVQSLKPLSQGILWFSELQMPSWPH